MNPNIPPSTHRAMLSAPMRPVCLLILMASAALNAAHWNQFRGPNGSGVANEFRPPIRIDPAKPAWKTAAPPSHSSPILWSERLFVTGVDGDRLVIAALNASDGKLRWKTAAPEVELAKVHKAGSNAASSPCADGERVYAYFGSYGLICCDHDGKVAWKRPLSTPKSLYGMSTSPILHDGKLILALDNDLNIEGGKLSRSKIVAFDGETGEIVWETARPYNRSGWSTPAVWRHEHGVEIAALGSGRAYGYDAATGAEKWFVNGFSRETIATPVIGDGRLFLSAARLGGSGDAQVDPEPFWKAALQFDRNKDGRVGFNEITKDFTIPLRPELPPGHPGFGLPLPTDPDKRLQRQRGFFAWRDANKDGFWTHEEFVKDMLVGRGRPNLSAIKPGGRGDITESHTAWTLRSGVPEIPSPIFHDGRLHLARKGGILSCINADNGRQIYRERLNAGGQYSASPVIANDRLYLVSDRGVISVVKTGDRFELEHQADLKTPVPATPALDSTTIYVRTTEGIVAFR